MTLPLLSRVRVIELGAAIASPFCTALLADAGAEVVKIETERRPDNLRGNWPMHEGKPGRERSHYYAQVNRNKQHLTLDLTNDTGRSMFLDLVGLADVVVENFAAGTMDRLGVPYERVRRANPSIVMLSLSGFGATGPAKNYVAYGPLLEGVTGMAALGGYVGGPPTHSAFVYTDYVSAMWGVSLVLAALASRARTGEGTWFDLSQCEVSLNMMPDAFLEAAVNGAAPLKRENRDEFVSVHGVYRCRGTDAWLALAARTEAEWAALVRAMEEPAWAVRPEYQSVAGRVAHQDEIDRGIGMWTSGLTRNEALAALRRHGVPAGPVYDIAEALADPHLHERGMFQVTRHPVIGDKITYASPVHFEGVSRAIRSHAPLWGEHNDRVCRELLGLDPAACERMAQVGAIR